MEDFNFPYLRKRDKEDFFADASNSLINGVRDSPDMKYKLLSPPDLQETYMPETMKESLYFDYKRPMESLQGLNASKVSIVNRVELNKIYGEGVEQLNTKEHSKTVKRLLKGENLESKIDKQAGCQSVVLPQINFAIFFARNRLALESTHILNNSELTKEFDEEIDDVCLASIQDDGFALAIRFKAVLRFVYVNSSTQLFTSKLTATVTKNTHLSYSSMLNGIVAVDGDKRIWAVKMDFKTNSVSKTRLFNVSKPLLSIKRLKKVSQYIPMITKRAEPTFHVKHFDTFLVIGRSRPGETGNKIGIYSLDQSLELFLYAKVDINKILELNKLILGEYYDILDRKAALVDFRYEIKADRLFLLFDSGIELHIDVRNGYVDRLVDYTVNLSENIAMDRVLGYMGESYINFSAGGHLYLIPSFNSRRFFMVYHDDEYAIALPFGVNAKIWLYNDYDATKGQTPTICQITANKLKFYDLVHEITQLYNILYIETFYNEFLLEDFFEALYNSFAKIGRDNLVGMLHKILLIEKNGEKFFNNEYLKYLKLSFTKEAEKLPYNPEKGNELYRIQRTALRFIYAFNGLGQRFEVPKPRTLLDSEIVEIEGLYKEKVASVEIEEPSNDPLLTIFYQEIGRLTEQTPLIVERKDNREIYRLNELLINNMKSLVEKSRVFKDQLFYLLEILIKDSEILNEVYRLQKQINFILGGKALTYIDPDQQKLLINSATSNDLRRTFYFLSYMDAFAAVFDTIADDYKKAFTLKPIKAFIVDKENDALIKYVLIDYSHLVRFKDKEFIDYYIKSHEKEALDLLNDIRAISTHSDGNRSVRGSEHIDGYYLIETCKKLEYRYISNYSQYFWNLGRFIDFLKLSLARLELNLKVIANYNGSRSKELVKREMENESIYMFLIGFLVAVVDSHNANKQRKEESAYLQGIRGIFSGIKDYVRETKKDTNSRLDVENALKALSTERLDDLMKQYITLVLSGSCTRLRVATLKVIIDNMDKKTFQFLALSKSLSELESLLDYDQLLKGSITVQNADFIIQLALSQKNYALAMNIIVELSHKNRETTSFRDLRESNILEVFTKPSSTITSLSKSLKAERLISLNLLDSYTIKAQTFASNLDPYNYETSELYGALQKITYSIKVNKLILKELNLKIDYLKSFNKLCHININFEEYHKLLEYLELVVEYIESCPDYVADDLVNRVVIPNRLHQVVLKLRCSKDAKADDYIGDLLTLIKAKSRVRNLVTLADLNSYIRLDSFFKRTSELGIQDLFKVKSPELGEKATLMAFDMKLLYPENIPKTIHAYIQKVFNDQSDRAKTELVETIEVANMQNKAFKDLGSDFTKVNSDRYFELSLWHLYPIVGPNNPQSSKLFELLMIYQKLINKNLNTNTQTDKLVYRLMDSFLILFNYALNRITEIIQSIRNSQAETLLVLEFLENHDRISDFLRQIKKSIENVNGPNFYIYFSFSDRVDKLLIRVKAVRNNSKMQHYLALRQRAMQ